MPDNISRFFVTRAAFEKGRRPPRSDCITIASRRSQKTRFPTISLKRANAGDHANPIGLLPERLQIGELKIVSSSSCAAFNAARDKSLYSQYLCAESAKESGTAICSGDSGGPLTSVLSDGRTLNYFSIETCSGSYFTGVCDLFLLRSPLRFRSGELVHPSARVPKWREIRLHGRH